MKLLSLALVTAIFAVAAAPSAVTAQSPVGTCVSVADGVRCSSFASQPSMISFGVDGRTVLIGLHWSRWSKAVAIGKGTLEENSGAPGHPRYVRHPASITATDIRTCAGGHAYTRLEVRSPRAWAHFIDQGCTPRSISTTHQCGSLGLPPAPQTVAYDIQADTLRCSTARQVARASGGRRFSPPYRYRWRQFACFGDVINGVGHSYVQYRCRDGEQMVWFEWTQ